MRVDYHLACAAHCDNHAMNPAVSADLVCTCGSVPTGISLLHQLSPQHINEEMVRGIEIYPLTGLGEELYAATNRRISDTSR
jgi:hypothetical protein